MVWGSRQQNDPQAPPASVNQPVTREKLPAKQQQLVDDDNDSHYYDDLYAP